MLKALFATLAVIAAIAAHAKNVAAHPHVWIDYSVVIEGDSRNGVSALSVKWRFDELFSYIIAADYDKDRNGYMSESESDLAREHLSGNLAILGWLTHLQGPGGFIEVEQVEDFTLSLEDGAAVMRFRIALDKPIPMKAFSFGMYDPTYYIAMSPTRQKSVTLSSGFDSACASTDQAETGPATVWGLISYTMTSIECKTG